MYILKLLPWKDKEVALHSDLGSVLQNKNCMLFYNIGLEAHVREPTATLSDACSLSQMSLDFTSILSPA